jgi:hypothetical protein
MLPTWWRVSRLAGCQPDTVMERYRRLAWAHIRVVISERFFVVPLNV